MRACDNSTSLILSCLCGDAGPDESTRLSTEVEPRFRVAESSLSAQTSSYFWVEFKKNNSHLHRGHVFLVDVHFEMQFSPNTCPHGNWIGVSASTSMAVPE